MAKFISLAEAVANLEKNPAIMKQVAELGKRQKEFPAKHDRQFNLELMNISMELNGRCQVIGMCTQCLLDNSRDMNERTSFYERRREELLLVTNLQMKYDKLVAKLDAAVRKEELAKA